MRRRSSMEYLRKGQLLKRIYKDDGSYETIAKPFRYQSVQGTRQTGGQLMNGFMHTDTRAILKAITELKYEKGDKVITDSGEKFEIIQVESEAFGEFGRIRNFRRAAAILFIS
jgi:hypothetical protein